MLTRAGLVAAVVLAHAFGQDAPWLPDITAANQALAMRDYATAAGKFDAALRAAESPKYEAAGAAQALRGLATVARLQGKLDDSARYLTRAMGPTVAATADTSLETADLLSELAVVTRASGNREVTITTLMSAIQIREKHETAREALARDLTFLGTLLVSAGDDRAAATLQRALETWDSTVAPDDLRILVVLDALGGVHRDAADYAAAEPLYTRALALRETAAGTDSADLIATLDSLAYVYFGQKKYEEAEPFYKRLLATWEASAGTEHPMVALTLEKMGVFYSAQDKYAEAEPLFERSLDIRMKAVLQSINHKGRAQVLQAKLKDAEGLYRSAVAMADSFQVPDELMDPMLRVYMQVAKELGKAKEAKAIDERIRAALVRKVDREGTRKPAPVR
jgi:tetratricopeptide (TPR) repeat protein